MPSTLPLVAILRIMTSEVGAAEQVVVLGETPVRLGRADDNDVVLLEQAASRHHARIEPSGDGGFQVVDLQSSGGLTINTEAVKHRRLSDGDEVRIGGTTIRFVENPGSEPTIVPTTGSPPSSLDTEMGAAPSPSPTDLGDADTMMPGESPSSTPTDVAPQDPGSDRTTEVGSTVHAPHEPAPSPAVLPPQATIQAPHQPAPPPPTDAAPEPAPAKHANSNASFVLGEGPSSPSAYSLDGPGAPAAHSGGYSLDGDDRGGLAMDTVPPTALQQSSGAGAYVLMVFLGAAASFGVLIALQGVPW